MGGTAGSKRGRRRARRQAKVGAAGSRSKARSKGAGKKGAGAARVPARGFASMSPARQREIARMGGQAAHREGTAHEFSPREAREAGRKGGEAVSRDRQHMARIGRKGGQR